MSIWMGIDVAKASLAVHLHPDARLLTLPNTPEGHAQLLAEVAGHTVHNVLLEATGGYERGILRALANAGLPVTRINPRRARAFAQAMDKDIAQARTHMDSDLGNRLLAIAGIGEVTTASLMAYLPELGQLDRRQIAALAGLAPSNVDSGQRKGKRCIRGGRAAIRRVLYMACWSVIRKQADFKARYQRLRQQGKCAKVALTACMRVLLVRLNAMARDKSEWIAGGG